MEIVPKIVKFICTKYSKILSVFFFVVLLGSYAQIFAIGSPYSPGATLDPACAPGDTNCTVTPTSMGGTINSATAGSVLFVGASGVLAEDTTSGSEFFYDSTNHRLGLGTTTPTQKIDIKSGAIRFTTLTAPTAPIAVLASLGAGNINNGTHIYKVTFVNGVGETELGTASSTVTVTDLNSDGQVNLTAIPTSTDTTVTARKIYRTKAGGSTYFPLVTISDNTTTTYTDNIADATMGTVAYSSNNSTSGAIYIDSTKIMSLYGTSNTFFGKTVGNQTTFGSGFNNAFGNTILSSLTSGFSNTAFGSFVLNSNLSGAQNVGIGVSTLNANTTGTSNVAIGNGALNANTTGGQNTAIGLNALASLNNLNAAAGSVAVGLSSFKFTTTGIRNVGLGQQAGFSNVTGSQNTAIGHQAGNGVSGNSYDNNVFLGYQSGNVITTGSNNTLLGTFTSDSITTGSNNIAIGYNVDLPSNTTSNQMTIGNLIFGTGIDGVNTGISTGNIGIGLNNPAYRFDVAASVASYAANIFNDGNLATNSGLLIQSGLDDNTAAGPSTLIGFKDGDGTDIGSITFGTSAVAYNTTSDQRLKENIVDTSLSLDTLMNIKIRDFTWKADSNHKLFHGVIAQELAQVYPQAVTVPLDENTGFWMVDYSKLTPLIVRSVQDLDITVKGITSLNLTEENSVGSLIKKFLADAGNTITDIFAGTVHTDTLCVKTTCINEDQLKQILNSINSVPATVPTPVDPVVTTTPVVDVVPPTTTDTSLNTDTTPVVDTTPTVDPSTITPDQPIVTQ